MVNALALAGAASAAPARSKNGQEAAFDFASFSHVSTTVSGLSDRDSMPSSISHCARSGWSLGPWPQMPTYLPLARACLIAIDSSFFKFGREACRERVCQYVEMTEV